MLKISISRHPRARRPASAIFGLSLALAACSGADTPGTEPAQPRNQAAADCQLVSDGYGPPGQVPFNVEVVAEGLSIPWGIDWLPNGDMLVTERGGALSRIDAQGSVHHLADVPIAVSGEGGLLGLAIHPQFEQNRWFYLYYTIGVPALGSFNQIERWVLAEDGLSAQADTVLLGTIPALAFHNGGRLRFGPDGHLYAGTGDAGNPLLSQLTHSPAGKILRLADDGSIPADNPFPASSTWVYGLRNTQGFDWFEGGRMLVSDHGPTSLPQEAARSGRDEITLASAGDNLGWPVVTGCEEFSGMLPPWISWADAMPPGGAAIYTGTEIPEWRGDVFVGVLGTQPDTPHLHRLRIDQNGVSLSETYLRGTAGFGRLREVVMGPDGGLYVTTSNCDGRGSCGAGDRILRIGRR